MTDGTRTLRGDTPTEPLTEIDAWLQPYRKLWGDRLDALEQHLDANPEGSVT